MKSTLDILQDYRMNRLELRALEKQYEGLLFIGGPSGELRSGPGDGLRGTNDAQAARIQAQDGVLELIARVRETLLRGAGAFELALAEIQDARLRSILRFYYGAGYTIWQIAEEMELCEKTVSRCRSAFIASMKGGG